MSADIEDVLHPAELEAAMVAAKKALEEAGVPEAQARQALSKAPPEKRSKGPRSWTSYRRYRRYYHFRTRKLWARENGQRTPPAWPGSPKVRYVWEAGGRSKYMPHQGKREKERRTLQLVRGEIVA